MTSVRRAGAILLMLGGAGCSGRRPATATVGGNTSVQWPTGVGGKGNEGLQLQ
jgi:hypothetical protein